MGGIYRMTEQSRDIEADWLHYSDLASAVDAVTDYLVKRINHAIEERGSCHLVFPGGTSPRQILKQLQGQEIPWQRLHLYPSDERCVPQGDPQRNDRLIEELHFPFVPIPEENLHRIPAELGPEQGALAYAQQLEEAPRFDIALLGMGEDGHTASLFPGNSSLEDLCGAVPVLNSPKPPDERVSIGLQRLLGARERIVLAFGEGKRKAIKQIKAGESLPVAMVHPTCWCLDHS